MGDLHSTKCIIYANFYFLNMKMSTYNPNLVAELFKPCCTNCPRIRIVGGSRPNGAKVGRFSSWGTVVPKGFLTKRAYKSHSAASYSKLGHPRI